MSPEVHQSQLDAATTQTMVRHYHAPDFLPNQCGSCLTQTIDSPLSLVWSLVRQFSNPQAYKQFVKGCNIVAGEGGSGTEREVTVVSGLPAQCSRERLDTLDDELHLMVFSIIGGDHRLNNYRSTTTLHKDDGDDKITTVIESFVVDVPKDSNKEDTCSFTEMIIGCNLRSLAMVSEKLACAP